MPFVRYSEMDVFVFGLVGGTNWGPDSPRGGLQNVNKIKHNSGSSDKSCDFIIMQIEKS